MNKQNLAIPLSIVVAGVIIAGAVFVRGNREAETDKKNPIEQNKKSDPAPITEKDHILGNPNAPITILEYSDTECPVCKEFHKVMVQIMDKFGKDGQVKWVYRHFPLDSIHPKSRKEMEATECSAKIGGNDKFWGFLNRLYEITPSTKSRDPKDGLDPKELYKIAEYIGLDGKAFADCLDGGDEKSAVEEDFKDAMAIGAGGTPYPIIISKDGTNIVIGGYIPYENLAQGLEEMIKENELKK